MRSITIYFIGVGENTGVGKSGSGAASNNKKEPSYCSSHILQSLPTQESLAFNIHRVKYFKNTGKYSASLCVSKSTSSSSFTISDIYAKFTNEPTIYRPEITSIIENLPPSSPQQDILCDLSRERNVNIEFAADYDDDQQSNLEIRQEFLFL